MKYFNDENTQGYSDAQLRELNARFEQRLIRLVHIDNDIIKNEAEKMITEFDLELAQ